MGSNRRFATLHPMRGRGVLPSSTAPDTWWPDIGKHTAAISVARVSADIVQHALKESNRVVHDICALLNERRLFMVGAHLLRLSFIAQINTGFKGARKGNSARQMSCMSMIGIWGWWSWMQLNQSLNQSPLPSASVLIKHNGHWVQTNTATVTMEIGACHTKLTEAIRTGCTGKTGPNRAVCSIYLLALCNTHLRRVIHTDENDSNSSVNTTAHYISNKCLPTRHRGASTSTCNSEKMLSHSPWASTEQQVRKENPHFDQAPICLIGSKNSRVVSDPILFARWNQSLK